MSVKSSAIPGDWAADVQTEIGSIKRATGRLIWVGLGTFAAWAFLFPLGSAVLGQGDVIAMGENKQVQHRTGGVVTDIYARNGDTVRAGDVIFRLDPVIDQAELGRLRANRSMLVAIRDRLRAESLASNDPAASISVTTLRGVDGAAVPFVVEAGFPHAAESDIVLAQKEQFEKGRAALQSEIDELTASRNALVSRIEGLELQTASTADELALVRGQVNAVSGLVSGGHVARKALWDLQQQQYSLQSRLASLQAEAGSARDEVYSFDARIAKLEAADAQDNARQMTETLGELAQVEEQLTAADAAVASTTVRAPVDGTVVHNKYTTLGGVVPAGEVLAEIVPDGLPLLLRARIAPADVASVTKGQKARAQIAGVNHRIHDDIEGIVEYVAADATIDPQTGQQYFDVDVRLTGLTDALRAELGVKPGMQGTAFIAGQSRTFASYVFKPMSDSLNRAFQEK